MQARSSLDRKVQNSVIRGPENSKLSETRVQNLMIHLPASACFGVMRSSKLSEKRHKLETDCQVSASFDFFSLKFELVAHWAQPDGGGAASSLSAAREAAVAPGQCEGRMAAIGQKRPIANV